MALEIFKLFGTILVNNDEANKSISKTEGHTVNLAKKMASGVATAGKWGAGIATTFGSMASGVVTALTKMGTDAMNTADKIDKMSQKIGVSRKAYQELDFICSQSGMDVDKLQGGMKTLTKTMDSAANGSKSAIDAFNKLGINIKDNNGNLKSQESIMWESMEALQKVKNSTEKATLANQLFGKSGSEMMPLLNGASGSIEEMKQKAEDLGLVISDDVIDSGIKLQDSLDQLKGSFDALKTNVGGAVIPVLQSFAEEGLKLVTKFVEAFRDDGLDGVYNAIDEIVPEIIQKFNEKANNFAKIATDIIEHIVWGIQVNLPIIMQGIIQIINILLQSAIRMLPKFIQLGTTIIVELSKGIAQALPTLIPAIIQAILTIVSTLLDNIDQIIESGIQILLALIQGILDTLPILIEKLPEVIEQICLVLAENLPKILEAGMQILDMLINGLIQSIPKLLEKLPIIIETIINFITNNLPEIIKTGIQVLIAFINGLIEAIPQLINMLPKIIETIVNTLTEHLSEIIAAGIEIIVALASGLIQAIPQLVSKVPEICTSIINTIISTDWLKVGIDIMSSIGSGLWNGLTGLLSDVGDVFGRVWQSIKDAIKLPHLKIDGSINPFKWFDEGLPSIGIEWYAKGGIMEQPTLFGINGTNAMVGGEAGPEAIAPISELQNYVEQAVSKKTDGLYEIIQKLYDLLREYMPELASKDIVLDSGLLVGAMINDIDNSLGKKESIVRRGR